MFATHLLSGRVELRRIHVWRYPAYEMLHDGELLATVGRIGWFRVYFGRGVPVELADGSRWRIRARTIGGFLCPVIVDGERLQIAVGSPGQGRDYDITCRDFGYGLFPASPKPRSRERWSLRLHETEVATVRLHPLSADATDPVHIGALVISFVLIRYGLPDETRPRLSSFSWR